MKRETRKEQRKRLNTMGIEDIQKPISPKTISGRLNGRKGGIATSKKYNKETRQRWGEIAGNSTIERYGADYYRQIGISGALHSTAKLNWKQVEEIREKHKKGETPSQLAKEYPVNIDAIYNIIKRRTWKEKVDVR